jgi:two-component system catabolic regulation response regulator CreB
VNCTGWRITAYGRGIKSGASPQFAVQARFSPHCSSSSVLVAWTHLAAGHRIFSDMKSRILVVEDEPGISDTIRYALATDGFEPIVCATGAEALARLADQAFSLIVLDVGLPDINGFELFKRLQKQTEAPIIFLTSRSDEIDRIVGLELGADDYIAKPFSPRELTARIRAVLRRAGNASRTAPATEKGQAVFKVDEERRRILYYGQALELSRYEYGLLKTLVARPGRVYSRDELLERVWDTPGESLDRTVDAHIKTLRSKMHVIAPGLDPIRTHRGVGYSLADDLPAALPGSS